MTRLKVFKTQKPPAQGFVFLLIVLTLLAIAGVVFLNGVGGSLASAGRQLQQTQVGNDVLVAAKAALIGYAVQSISAGNRLGNFPTPDILNSAGTAISYDGLSDGNAAGSTSNKCLSSANAATNGLPGTGPATGVTSKPNQRCLGKFPWREFNLDVGSPDTNDLLGQIPWLAISANLNEWDKCLATLNSDILNSAFASGACPAPANTTPYPWMRVVDQNGSTLSDRVVAVLIMAGPPIQTGNRTQSRTPANPGAPVDYLDVIATPLGCVTSCTATFDNADLAASVQTFIQIPPGTRYPANAENVTLAGQMLNFNDALIYITIDELMPYLERRVLSEMASSLRSFKGNPATGFTTYPWLQPLSSSFGDNLSLSSQPQIVFGAFPFMSLPAGAPVPHSYRTDFSWSLSSASETTTACYQVGTAPLRYMRNPLIGTLNAATAAGGPFATGSATVSEGACSWQGSAKVSCMQNLSLAGATLIPVTLYTTLAGCNSQTGPIADTLLVTKNIALSAECLTPATLVKPLTSTDYTTATSSSAHKWSWKCINSSYPSMVQAKYTFTNTASTTYNKLPITTDVSSAGGAQIFSVTGMNYHPIMPEWFFQNGWYLSAFAALAPAGGIAPTTPSPNPCGTATTLITGTGNSANAIVMLAGARLPVLPAIATQARPSAAISNYLEAPNKDAGTTCMFSTPTAAVTANSNDQIFIVSP